MQITADFTRLHSGENLSRRLEITVEQSLRDKRAKLGFITPMGCIYFTKELSLEDGKGEFLIPSALTDGRGMLLCQLFLWDDEGFIAKSPVEEFPVYPSVDDSDCPVIGEDTKKSLALIFEYIEGKADSIHSHDDRYYTKQGVEELLQGEFGGTHNHDGRYYTREETDSALEQHTHTYGELSDKPQINGVALLGNKSMNKFMFRRVLTSADDCDRLFEDGWYVYSTSSVPKNAPFPNASVIEVFGADSTTTQKVQRGYRYGEAGHGAFRALYNSKWHPWSKIPVIQSKVMQHNTTSGGNADLTLPVSSSIPLAAYGESLDGKTTYRCTFYKSPTYAKWFGHFTGNSNETPVANTDIKVTVYYINL